MLTVSKRYPTDIFIDGEKVRIYVKRFTQDEAQWFNTIFERVHQDEAAAEDELKRFAVRHRRAQADLLGVPLEEVTNPEPVYLLGLFEAELGPEATKARRKAFDLRVTESNAFALESITKFVTVAPGQIYDEDEKREVLTGEDLVAHFGGRGDVLVVVLGMIRLENQLTAEQKKRLSALSGSMPTSPASNTAPGPTPAAAATSVASWGTARPAPASARRKRIRSGPTASSSVGSVQS